MKKNRFNFVSISLVFLSLAFCLTSCMNKQGIKINNQLTDAPVQYGISEINNMISEQKTNQKESQLTISTKIDQLLGNEAFSIESKKNHVNIIGGDAVGVMYGLLYVKEQLQQGKTSIAPVTESPGFSFRAVKFNLPWDSYRRGEALQLHEETCRDTIFWRNFLDMMVENRFNKLTLWNLHPFNYLVKTEKYPEACGFSDEEMAAWETFWKSLFRMAKERGIETYLVNWNIFVSPEFAKAHNVATYCFGGSYFVDMGDTSEIVKDYTREVVKAVIDKYPDLTGLGITLGEGMGGMTADEREQWLLDSFIQGMRAASRKIKFIHRVPLSAGKWSGGTTDPIVERMTRKTLDTLSCVDGPITIELKFNWSHAHSCPELIKVHGGELTDAYWNPRPENYKLSWMMRNEDFFALRWGQPDFIRQHIEKNGTDYVNGYFVGSECYIPAKDYFTALPGTSYRWAFERQWMFYKQWGRLLYNPDTPDQLFVDAFEARFPSNGAQLFEAQRKASRVPLILASYWNATWDFTLYSEGMMSIMNQDSMKLISLTDICKKQPMAPNYIGIGEFLANGMKNTEGKISPVQLADTIDSFCNSILKEIQSIPIEGNVNLRYEVSDIKTWALLGLYFSNKLRAAVDYQQFLNSGKKEFLRQAVTGLEKAAVNWHSIVEITKPIYNRMPLQHLEKSKFRYFHWENLEREVQEELKWIKSMN